MKKAFTLSVLLLAGLSYSAVLDGLAAKVNDNVITIGDVLAEMRRDPNLKNGMDREFAESYSNAVERMIDRRLILKAAADKGMTMQEWLIDNRIREILKESFDSDMNKLTAALAESKIAITDWRNNLRDEMMISAMRFQTIDKNIVATPTAMQNEFLMHRDRYAAEANVTVSVILLRPVADGDTTTPSVSTRGEEILARLEKGESFADLARLYSADSHAKDGGVWEKIDPEESFRPEIAETIAKLKVGEFSTLVNLDGWGFIVRKDAESVASQLSFAEAYDQIEQNVKRDLAKEQYAAWMARLRAEAFVKIYPMPSER